MTGVPDPALPEVVWAYTADLRRAAAAAARLRLPWQLDFRLDTVLDPDGIHVLHLYAVLERDPATGQPFPEPVARCAAMPQFSGVDAGVAFHLALDLRVSDYAACQPMPLDQMQASTVTAVRDFMRQLRGRPDIFDPRRAGQSRDSGQTAVIARPAHRRG